MKSSSVSIIGSVMALLLATACCWLPLLAISLGGVASFASISRGLEEFSGLFMIIAAVLFTVAVYQLHKIKQMKAKEAILSSTITCPECGHKKEETMPTNACQYFYECENCKKVLKPLKGDCCVYCSYGTVACPPIQQGESCC